MLEGTSFSFDTAAPVEDQDHPSIPLTEMSLQKQFQTVLAEVRRLSSSILTSRNYERLASFQASAHTAGRQLVWEPDDAAVLTTMTDQKPDAILGQTISLTDIARDPQHYVLQNSFDHLERLTDMPITTYIHGNGEATRRLRPAVYATQRLARSASSPLRFMECLGSC